MIEKWRTSENTDIDYYQFHNAKTSYILSERFV